MNGGWYFLWAFGWLRLFRGGFRVVVVGRNGHVRAKSTENDTGKNGFGPLNTAA